MGLPADPAEWEPGGSGHHGGSELHAERAVGAEGRKGGSRGTRADRPRGHPVPPTKRAPGGGGRGGGSRGWRAGGGGAGGPRRTGPEGTPSTPPGGRTR